MIARRTEWDYCLFCDQNLTITVNTTKILVLKSIVCLVFKQFKQ